tara:strand:- start:148 stop:492 length:345 start_codon:yes stop_codon:yes gene_type:complete
MNTSTINIINSISLIAMGIWGYIDVSSVTALIPTFFGIALILCTNGLKKENKMISHIAVLLTLLILGALLGMRLPKSIDQGGIGLIRVIIMIGTSAVAMLFFINSFIRARRNKN